jgi:SOS-response transcriptional repressor LexA
MHKAECVCLDIAGEPSGVILLDPVTDISYIRLRRDWSVFLPQEADVLSLLEDDLQAKAREMGGRRLLDFLLDHCSNLLRLSDAQHLQVADFQARLNRIYRETVKPRVLPYMTHVPLTTLRAAAGQLSEQQTVSGDEWIELPPDIQARDRMFVAQVTGRSMEPRIPDGSLCLFRHPVAGTRQGRLLLIQKYGEFDATAQFTVKRYTSTKAHQPDGSWRHESIRLEPLNSDFSAWELQPEEFGVLAEFLAVLPPEE